jgi:cellulose 1,4-beta-cellobiosidase
VDWANNSEADLAGYRVILGKVANLSDGAQVATPTASVAGLTGLTAGTRYYVAIRAVDSSNNVSANSTIVSFVTGSPDVTPPSPPTGLVVNSITQTSANVDWANNSEADLAGYRVILGKAANLSDGAQVATPTASVAGLTGLTAGTTYYVAIRAVDSSNNVSANSTIVSFTTTSPDLTPPAIPTGLVAGAVSSSSVSLSWASNSESDFASYSVYYALVPNFTTSTGTAAGNPTAAAASIGNLAANTTYYVRVLAKDLSGNASALSTPLTIKTAQGALANIGASFFTSTNTSQSNTMGGRLVIKNNGSTPLSLADVKVKFYMNNDGKALNFWCDHAGGNAGNNYVSFTNAVSAPIASISAANANTVLTISFSSAAPTILAGQFVEVQFRVTTSDWSNMNPLNDWSLTDPTHLVVMYQGNKVSGIEP